MELLFLSDLISLLAFKEDESLDKLEYFLISSNISEILLISLVWIELELKDEILISSGIFILDFDVSEFNESELHPLKILFNSILSFGIHFEIFGIKVNLTKIIKINIFYKGI